MIKSDAFRFGSKTGPQSAVADKTQSSALLMSGRLNKATENIGRPRMKTHWEVVHEWSVEIWFRIQKDEDGYPESKSWEQLLAWPVAERDDYFSLESIPFFVKGIARGDIVRAKLAQNSEVQEGEFFEFDYLVQRGGHNTYRLLLRRKRPDDPDFTEDELLKKGLALEIEYRDFFAIDVPPSVNQQEIDEFLISELRSGRWELQDGHLCTPQARV